MSIELMLLSANINFVGFSYLLNDLSGQTFSLFILVVAAAEDAIGLAILTIFFKKTSSISIDNISNSKRIILFFICISSIIKFFYMRVTSKNLSSKHLNFYLASQWWNLLFFQFQFHLLWSMLMVNLLSF